jgi:hypothetical protein
LQPASVTPTFFAIPHATAEPSESNAEYVGISDSIANPVGFRADAPLICAFDWPGAPELVEVDWLVAVAPIATTEAKTTNGERIVQSNLSTAFMAYLQFVSRNSRRTG